MQHILLRGTVQLLRLIGVANLEAHMSQDCINLSPNTLALYEQIMTLQTRYEISKTKIHLIPG